MQMILLTAFYVGEWILDQWSEQKTANWVTHIEPLIGFLGIHAEPFIGLLGTHAEPFIGLLGTHSEPLTV